MNKINPKKSLGQNFLKDGNVVHKIIKTANIDKETTVIEVGPGLGAMTKELVKESGQVIAIEIDQRLIPHLKKEFAESIVIINDDFLQITEEQLVPQMKYEKVKLVANLPYYITTAIIMKVLLDYQTISEVYVMVQKEVAERITSASNNKSYNSLSVICQTLTDVKYEFTVKRSVFEPQPKVDSAIISFKRKDIAIDIYSFEKFVKNCFQQKRKQLINNLHATYEIPKQEIKEFLKGLGIPETIRAEQIEVEEFQYLWEEFIKYFEK